MNPAKILAGIEPLAGGEITQVFAGGPASQSYRVRSDGADYVLRVDGVLAQRLGLDRQNEIEILAAVATAGVGPEVIYSDREQGLLVTKFIAGTSWQQSEMLEPDALRRLAALLQRVHGLPAVGRPFGLQYKLSAYAQAVNSAKADELALEALDILEGISSSPSEPCLCHNDVTFANIVDGDELVLIDWEYAAIGDPFFDLATVVQHHGLDDSQSIHLLRCYFGQAVDEDIVRLQSWCEIYGRVAALWEAAVERLGAPQATD